MAASEPEVFDQTLEVEKGFTNFCRVCMSSKVVLKNVFSTELDGTVEELMYCTGILMTQDDGLPAMLCDSCLRNLSVAYKFKNTCLRSDKIFRQFLKENIILKQTIKEEVIDVFIDDYEQLLKQEIKCDNDDCVTKQEAEKGDKNDYVGDICHIKDEQRETQLTNKTEMARARQKDKSKKKINSPLEKKQKFRRLYCNICDISFSSKKLCLQHKRKVHKDKWICEICGKQFTYHSSHQSHIKSHFPPNIKCSLCDYKTWHKSDMTKHIRTHTGVKHYACEFCTSTFNNTSNLYGHMRRIHGGGEPKTKNCPRCDMTFFTEDKLRRHIDTHDNIKRHECEVCHALFARRCYWKRHLLKQHNISVPQLRPGRRKVNDVMGDVPEGDLLIVEAIAK